MHQICYINISDKLSMLCTSLYFYETKNKFEENSKFCNLQLYMAMPSITSFDQF